MVEQDRDKTVPIREGKNLAIAGLVLLNSTVFFLVLPLIAAWSVVFAVVMLVPLVLSIVPHWGLIHEAVHGHLTTDRRRNDRVARVLSIAFLAPFDTLRFGHLAHHALNARTAERAEIYDPTHRSPLAANALYYFRLLGGLHGMEVLSGLLSLLPRTALRPIVRGVFFDGAADAPGMADRAERALLEPRTLRRIRQETVVIIMVAGTSIVIYGELWPLLAVGLLGRAFLISFLDNAPHYDGELSEPYQGYDMRLPKAVSVLVLHSNYHGTHHRHPSVPWTALPETFVRDRGQLVGSYLRLPWRQLRGAVPAPPRPS